MKLLKNLKRMRTLKTDSKKIKLRELAIKSRTENLTTVRSFVRTAAEEIDMPSEVIEDIILAVDEAATNIIKHAYNSFPDGEILVKIKYSHKRFTIIITDHGAPFESSKVPKPDIQKYYRQHRVGGLGMYLMKTLMDDVKYISVPGEYNQVLLTKNLNGSGG